MTTDEVEGERVFRNEVRDWLVSNFPAELTGRYDLASATEAPPEPFPALVAWRDAVAAKGWGTPTWPAIYGGGGLSDEEAEILAQEMEMIGAWNPIGGMGVMMLGPTLLESGTEAQKHLHLPRIARGEIRWCQGYSEPGAGSDLAALSCRAEDRGDHYLVNGQKIWTSGAQWADWCFALVRTDPARKQEGISFLLIDMRSPGIVVKPIRMISGSSPFCETFFTDVAVPKDNLVGPLNGGWTIGKRLLQHERSGISASSRSRAAGQVSLREIADAYLPRDSTSRLADGDLRARIVRHEMEAMAFALTGRRIAAESERRGPSQTSSILKNVGAGLAQERGDLVVEIMGRNALGWEGQGFAADELEAARTWLFSKAVSIYGGTTEVQNNIVAKRILGLNDR